MVGIGAEELGCSVQQVFELRTVFFDESVHLLDAIVERRLSGDAQFPAYLAFRVVFSTQLE